MIIELLNGTRFDIANYGLGVEDYDIPSVEMEHTVVDVDGSNSTLIIGTRFKGRTIPVIFAYLASDYHDYLLLRNELNALFTRKEAFYIIFKDEPHKRWLVKTATQFSTVKDLETVGSMPVNFLCAKSFAESIATTQALKEWDVDNWAWDGTIDWDEELKYVFTSNDFIVKNLGNIEIDPCEHELEIVLKGTFPSNVKITNQTTGEVYQYNRPLSPTDELRISGICTFRNGISDFRNTNYKLLTLAVGDNIFTVEGGTLTSIAFNFRFLYK